MDYRIGRLNFTLNLECYANFYKVNKCRRMEIKVFRTVSIRLWTTKPENDFVIAYLTLLLHNIDNDIEVTVSFKT